MTGHCTKECLSRDTQKNKMIMEMDEQISLLSIRISELEIKLYKENKILDWDNFHEVRPEEYDTSQPF